MLCPSSYLEFMKHAFRFGASCGGCGGSLSPFAFSRCCCRMPPPPDHPRLVAETCSFVPPGGAARLCLRLTNDCDQPKTFSLELNPIADAKLEGVSAPEVQVGALGRAQAFAQVIIPPEACVGTVYDRVLTVRACNTHFVRWTLQVGFFGFATAHRVDITDCGPQPHEWSDHFHGKPQG